MSIRLYLDEDVMRAALVQALRSKGIELITAFEAGMSGEADDLHLRYAASQGLVLYSSNIADYMTLHTTFLS